MLTRGKQCHSQSLASADKPQSRALLGRWKCGRGHDVGHRVQVRNEVEYRRKDLNREFVGGLISVDKATDSRKGFTAYDEIESLKLTFFNE